MTAQLVDLLIEHGLTIAVAESLTGGLVAAELVAVPGVSAVFNGGVVAYNSAIKHAVLGVDAELLAAHGAVHPEVARQMAVNVRTVLAVDGVAARVGLSTTGVAGPAADGGRPAGTVFLGIAIDERYFGLELCLEGDRQAIRLAACSELFSALTSKLESN